MEGSIVFIKIVFILSYLAFNILILILMLSEKGVTAMTQKTVLGIKNKPLYEILIRYITLLPTTLCLWMIKLVSKPMSWIPFKEKEVEK